MGRIHTYAYLQYTTVPINGHISGQNNKTEHEGFFTTLKRFLCKTPKKNENIHHNQEVKNIEMQPSNESIPKENE